MKKPTPVALVAAPTIIVAGALPNAVAANLRVVDAGTGETIERVLDADSDAGTVRRYAVKDGNLVREGDSFKVVDEKRDIRIDWIDPPIVDEVSAGEPAAEESAA